MHIRFVKFQRFSENSLHVRGNETRPAFIKIGALYFVTLFCFCFSFSFSTCVTPVRCIAFTLNFPLVFLDAFPLTEILSRYTAFRFDRPYFVFGNVKSKLTIYLQLREILRKLRYSCLSLMQGL